MPTDLAHQLELVLQTWQRIKPKLMNIKRYLHTHSHVHKTHCNESTTGADASVKAQTHKATRSASLAMYVAMRCNRVGNDRHYCC